MKSGLVSSGALCALIVATLLGATSNLYAQYPEDALRLGTPGIGVGARALGMGNAYTGVASDYSAIYWNPAGLAQAQRGEFFMGMSFVGAKDNGTLSSRDELGNVTLLGSATGYSSNSTNLNALGVVYPVPVRRGSLVVAFGYDRRANFGSGVSFSGFNPLSTIIQSWSPNGQLRDSTSLGDYLAYNLYLTNLDSLGMKYKGLFFGKLTQLGTVLESGGLNDYSVSGAMDIAKDLSLGISLTYIGGSYRYDRTYREQDNQHIFAAPNDLKQLTVREFVDGNITGFNAKFGLLYRVPDRFRLGINISPPSTFNIRESFGTDATSEFYTVDQNTQSNLYRVGDKSSNEYDVHTPWVFSAGASVILRDLVLAGDVEYTDWTELEFARANSDLIAANADFKTLFRGTTNLRAGAEYDIRELGVRVRGGFMYNPSPYQGDSSPYDRKYITGGLGILLGESAMLDLAYAHGWWKTHNFNYGADYTVQPVSAIEEDIRTNTFLMTLVYRF